MRHPLIALVVPDGLVVLAAAALLHSRTVLAPAAPVLPAIPAIVLVTALALAIRFGRGRVLLALVILAVADRALVLPSLTPALREAVALLVPVSLAGLGLVPERGVLTAATGRRLGAVAVAGLGLLLLRQSLGVRFFPAGLTGWSPVGDPGLIAFAGGLAVLGGMFIARPSATARGLFWSVVAMFLALSAPAAGASAALAPSTFLLATAGLVLGLAVIEESHAMAYRDALTGLESRRALDEAMRSIDGGFTIAMVDVDHFKRCNDSYGHEVGDQVLRMVAVALERVTAGARVFRYGGEEFAVLFPNRAADDCLAVLEQARAAVEGTTFTLRSADRPKKRPRKPTRRSRGHAVAVTVSIGVADRTAPDASPEDVVRDADKALYKAKHAGRNRVELGGKRRAHV